MSEIRKKSPVAGGILSFFFPGAGQLYNEDYGKGIILIVAAIATIVTIVYHALSLGGIVMSGEIYSVTMQIVTIVAAGLILLGIWIYGIIDAILTAQHISAAVNSGSVTAESRRIRSQEGTIGLGVVLIIVGILGVLIQMGLKLEYLIRYGLPVALILIGAYLLAKTNGWIKGGK